MKQNTFSLVIVGLITALVAWGISSALVPSEVEEKTYDYINIDIPAEFPQLDEVFFNEESIDTFKATAIGTTETE